MSKAIPVDPDVPTVTSYFGAWTTDGRVLLDVHFSTGKSLRLTMSPAFARALVQGLPSLAACAKAIQQSSTTATTGDEGSQP